MSRHAEADTRPVTIERSDAIDAAGALLQLAEHTRRESRSRYYAGPERAGMRAGMRRAADVYEEAAHRVQRAADDAF